MLRAMFLGRQGAVQLRAKFSLYARLLMFRHVIFLFFYYVSFLQSGVSSSNLIGDSDNRTKLNIMCEICDDTNYDSNMVYIQILPKRIIQLLTKRQLPRFLTNTFLEV